MHFWLWIAIAVAIAVITPGLLSLLRSARPRAGLDFNIIDEAIHHLDTEDEPWTVHLEARVAGSIDEQRLRAAVAKAIVRHPMARAFQKRWRPWQTVYQWGIAEHVSRDAVSIESHDDDAGVAEARARFQSMRVPIDAPPPFRVLLVRHPGGDYVMLNINHAASDGVGTLRLFRSIARNYANDPDPQPETEDLAVRNLTLGTAPTTLRQRWDRLTLLREALFGAVFSPPSRVAPDGGRDGQVAFRFELLAVAKDLVSRMATLKLAGGTVNDLLLAVLHQTIQRWNDAHGGTTERIGTMMPVNMRPSDRWFEVVSNITYFVSISTSPTDRADIEKATRAVAEQTRRIKDQGIAAALREILIASPALLLEVKRRMPALLPLGGNRFVDTAVLSNIGRVSEAVSFGDAGPTRELWFSPPCRMPLGLGVGTATYDGRLFIVFRYRTAMWGEAAARQFAGLFERTLVEAVAGRPASAVG